MTKNERIKQTQKETKERHSSMTCRVIEVKVLSRKLTNTQKEKINKLFLEAKWFKNYCIGSDNLFELDNKIKDVKIKVKDDFEMRHLDILGSQIKQRLLDDLKDNVRALATKKENGEKVGPLKFKSFCNSIPLKQYENTYKIDFSKNIITVQNLKVSIPVKGLDQIKKDFEITNAKFIRKASGLYFHIIIFENKKKNIPHKKCGIDFGIKNNLTLDDGTVYNILVPETKSVKLASKRLNKAFIRNGKKKSKNHYKRVQKLQKAYEKQNNKKTDIANKIVSELTSNYDFIAMQDELINLWHKGLFGQQVQHSAMGQIKAKLKKNSATHVVDSTYPSTQICPMCFKNTKHTLDKRDYDCKYCGYHNDNRDSKAASMILYEAAQEYVSAERRANSLVEAKTSAKSSKTLVSLADEARSPSL